MEICGLFYKICSIAVQSNMPLDGPLRATINHRELHGTIFQPLTLSKKPPPVSLVKKLRSADACICCRCMSESTGFTLSIDDQPTRISGDTCRGGRTILPGRGVSACWTCLVVILAPLRVVTSSAIAVFMNFSPVGVVTSDEYAIFAHRCPASSPFYVGFNDKFRATSSPTW